MCHNEISSKKHFITSKILIMCLYHYFSLLLTIIEVNSKYYIAMTKDTGYVISANANDLLESVERYFVQLWPRKLIRIINGN